MVIELRNAEQEELAGRRLRRLGQWPSVRPTQHQRPAKPVPWDGFGNTGLLQMNVLIELTRLNYYQAVTTLTASSVMRKEGFD